jgi:CheY-like chemotaxis protein
MTDEPKPTDAKQPLDADSTLAGFVFTAATQNIQYHYAPVLLTLMGESNPMRLIVESPEVVIGRSKDCDFSLQDNTASRQHCKLVFTNCGNVDQKPAVLIYDLQSRNGITVNGVKVNGHVPLRDNARINVGDTQLGYYVISIPRRPDGAAVSGEVPAMGTPSGELKAADVATSTPAATGASASRPAASVTARNIAIVDSDFEFASDLRERLTGLGRYRAIVYRKIENAIGNFEAFQPHMLLLDGDMPGESCLDMCAKLKAQDKWKNIPIILVFDHFDPTMVRNALKAGAQSYLIKPVADINQLTSRIDIHMNINRMMPQVS